MKRILFLFLLLPMICGAQIDSNKITNIEKFSNMHGYLIQKEFIEIGNISHGGLVPEKCKIELLVINYLIKNITFKGVRLEYGIGENSQIGFIDSNEIEGVMKAIKIIQTNIIPQKEDNYTEVEFTSKGGFEIGCYYKIDHWQYFMKVDFSASLMNLKKDDVDNLYSFLQDARAKM